MKKSDIIDSMSKISGQSKNDSEKAMNALIEVLSSNMSQEQEIRLFGFGTFSVTERKARQGRNPKTGETIQIKARKVATFKPSKELRDMINPEK